MKLKIHYSFYILVFLSIFSGLYKELLIMLISIGLHEAFHIVASLIFKCKINKITITLIGGIVEIEIKNISKLKEFIINISGIVANFIILFITTRINLFRYNEIFYEYNILLILFNIIPIYPLDGFHIIECLLKDLKKVGKWFNILLFVSYLFLTLFGIYAILLNSIGLAIIFMYLLYQNIYLYYQKDNIVIKKIVAKYKVSYGNIDS